MSERSQSPALRICHVNTLLDGGGTDEFCVQLALALQGIGAEIWIAGRSTSRYVPMIQKSAKFQPLTPKNKFKIIFGLAQAIRRNRIQVVHAHHGRDYWPTIIGARISGCAPKVVLSRHLASSPGAWISRHLILSQCDAMVAVSHFVEKLLREGSRDPQSDEPSRHWRPPMRGNPAKIRMAYGGIDTGRFLPLTHSELRVKWNLLPEHFAFGVVGAYNKPRGKGQREFLQAAARIHEKVPNARFLMIGYGTLSDTLKEDITRLGLSGKAWLTPFCTDMPQGMNAIDCLVHPAVGSEALGLAVCEATACGRPVIASDMDGIPEALVKPEYGTLVKPGSVDDLESAMLHWGTRPRWSSAERMAAHEALARKFSLESAAQRYLNLYAGLLASGHRQV